MTSIAPPRRSSNGAAGWRIASLQAAVCHHRSASAVVALLAAAACAAIAIVGLPAKASAAIVHPFVSSFGSFNYVKGVAVDQATEDVYVYDSSAKKIYKFTASGAPAEFSFTKADAISGVSEAGTTEGELAVDSSTSEAKGDIYLAHGGEAGIEIFNEAGEDVGALTEAAGVPWGETCGVAVDEHGDVYVGIYGVGIDKYVPKGSVVTNGDYAESIPARGEQCNLAVDSAFNVFGALWSGGPVERWSASQFGTSDGTGTVVSSKGTALAVDPASSELYVDQGSDVSQYGPHGEPFEAPVSTFASSGAGAVSSSYGVAVNGKTHDVYVANHTEMEIFGPGVHTPTVLTGPPASVQEHSAVVSGTVSPEGNPLTTCAFEYGQGESFEHSVSCAETVGQIGAGSKAVPVEAELTGLTRATPYSYRLVVTSAGGEYQAAGRKLTTAGPPVIAEEGIAQATSGEATVTATINPEYLQTSYRVEYGPSEAYGSSTAQVSLPQADQEGHSVSVTLSGLSASTLYHFRFVARSSAGEAAGGDEIVMTFSPTTSALPDERGYEQVTPEQKYGTEAYQPPVFESYAYEEEVKRENWSNTQTTLTFQAAADGSALAYVMGPLPEGGIPALGYGSGNEYLARRSAAGGWSQKLLSPEGALNSIFQAFSPSLDTAIVSSYQPLSPDAPGFGETTGYAGESYDTLYAHSTAGGAYVPFFSAKPPYRTVKEFGTALGTAINPETPDEGTCHFGSCINFEGASADYTHLLFAANDALTEASEGRPAAEGGANPFAFRRKNNLYELVNGRLRLVNVLPDGTTQAGATFGAIIEENENKPRVDFSHVISADGSRIFWTDLDNYHIYMREDGARTVEISPQGTYQTATADGSTVYYTNGDLYAYDVQSGQTTDLTPGVTVNQVAGASENGEYVYYVTAAGDLGVWHDGASRTITTFPVLLDVNSETLTAEATPDGRSIVFQQVLNKRYPKVGTAEVLRVWDYDAETQALDCVSCTSLGSLGRLQMTNSENVYKPRWISADGSRVFFVSMEGLVPQDTNEEQDVYEWERDGSGTCRQASGCVYILTAGTGSGQSSFLDASESGDDVFVVTRANLDGSDEDDAYDIYDVRVGATRALAAPFCTGTGCQGVPPSPPTFAAPPTVTFSGTGNLTAKQAKAHNHKRAKRRAAQRRKRRLRAELRRCRERQRHRGHAQSACKRAARRAKSGRGQGGRAPADRHHNGRGKR